jgi:hypothetical protein
MSVSFDDKTKSRFFLSALQQKCIEVDQFVDQPDYIPDADLLPEEITLTELVLRIKDIHSFRNSSTAVINRYVRPTNDQDSSNPHHNRQSSSSDSHPPRPSLSDSCPFHDFRTHINTQCLCGCWGHSVDNCQQMAMHFLVAKYLQKNANMTSAAQIYERWRLTNEKYSQSVRSMVHVIRTILPEDMDYCIDDKIMDKLYNEDDALSYSLYAIYLW